MDEIEGIIINEKAYGETSKIINIMTKDGIIGAIAKGAKSIKSELRSSTTKLTYAKFHLFYKKDKLSTISSVDLIDTFKNIKTDLKKISYASFLIDLSEQVYKQSSNSDIYFHLINSLIKINENFDPMVITNILELKYLSFLGVDPIIDACAVCGSNVSIMTLSASRGGYICRNCYKGESLVSDKTIKLIRMYFYVDISKITKLDVSEKSKTEINNFLDEYYSEYTGLYLKTKEFLKNLKNL